MVSGASVLSGLLIRRRVGMAAPAALFATVVSLYLLAAVWLLPAADHYKSARPFGEKVRALVPADRPLRSYALWKWRASYIYYCDRQIPRLQDERELRRFWNRDDRVFLLVERAGVDEARSVIGEVQPLVWDEVGSNAVYLFTNR